MKIAANHKLFYKHKGTKDDKSVTKTPHKDTKPIPHTWCHPEPHEHNKHIIFGKPHTYNPAKPGWNEDETPPSGLAAVTPPPAILTTSKVDTTATETTSLIDAETRQTVLDLINLLSSGNSIADA